MSTTPPPGSRVTYRSEIDRLQDAIVADRGIIPGTDRPSIDPLPQPDPTRLAEGLNDLLADAACAGITAHELIGHAWRAHTQTIPSRATIEEATPEPIPVVDLSPGTVTNARILYAMLRGALYRAFETAAATDAPDLPDPVTVAWSDYERMIDIAETNQRLTESFTAVLEERAYIALVDGALEVFVPDPRAPRPTGTVQITGTPNADGTDDDTTTVSVL